MNPEAEIRLLRDANDRQAEVIGRLQKGAVVLEEQLKGSRRVHLNDVDTLQRKLKSVRDQADLDYKRVSHQLNKFMEGVHKLRAFLVTRGSIVVLEKFDEIFSVQVKPVQEIVFDYEATPPVVRPQTAFESFLDGLQDLLNLYRGRRAQ
jgi:hypothetical protein